MTPDYFDMLRALNDAGADFLLVGAHARAIHCTPRATGDLDLWIRKEPANAERVHRALAAFGAPLGALSCEDLLDSDVVYQIGVAPNRIDLLTDLTRGFHLRPRT